MTVISEAVHELNGYKLHIVKTEKYKTNTIVWKMKAPLSKEDVTQRALLPYVLQSSTKNYPTTTKLRSYLDDLYGASMFIDLSKKGEYHVISISIEIANEKFLSDPTPLLKKGLELLSEIVTNPNSDGSSFESETVTKEKRALAQRIQSVFDDKMKYSSSRLVEEMCKEEPYSLHVHGELNDVEGITPESLFQYYERALAEDELDLYIIGDVEEEEVISFSKELLQFEARIPSLNDNQISRSVSQVNEVKERQDVKQGKLNIGYRTNVVYGSEDYYALQVFNGIFGGFSHSKLFLNVREKASLAYYVGSRLESHKGLMMVMSGIDEKNYEQAVRIVNEQMQAMQSGDFTDQEIEQTKAVIRNQLLETIDTARGMVEILYHNVVAKKNITLDEWLEKMEQVSKESIVGVANKVQQDTIYFLTGTEAIS
ncbi:pitrilysin family protein [Bacillus sp. 31A1R]|uniref:Pitrilysin family protein n=1 Tax=Robertmurraya mangrovi TaxID=3098077 RepID=A0ABU5J1V9_9BACI|nr:pitrilysin family protein [Bacillus sp. 31A1R]MDZ5473412.1 pitrilysin family protein [Bacillus sp. 31A1R]